MRRIAQNERKRAKVSSNSWQMEAPWHGGPNGSTSRAFFHSLPVDSLQVTPYAGKGYENGRDTA